MAPLGGVAHNDIAVFVEFIGIGIKARSHGEGVAGGETQTNIGGEWTPRLIVCRQIVRHRSREFVDERNFAESAGVGIRLEFHFHIVGNAHVDASLAFASGVAKNT